MGEEYYNLLLHIWTLNREELLITEDDKTKHMNDYEVWFEYVTSIPEMKDALYNSCLVFFHKKVEFFPLTHTMYIGEGDTGILLDFNLYSSLKKLFLKLDYTKNDDKQEEQFKETQKMSERERKIYERLKEGEARLSKIKNGDANTEDLLGRQIVALTAIGHYTFTEVYNMTMLQFSKLLKKYLEIDNYELRMMLSPYINSEEGDQDNKHWLN